MFQCWPESQGLCQPFRQPRVQKTNRPASARNKIRIWDDSPTPAHTQLPCSLSLCCRAWQILRARPQWSGFPTREFCGRSCRKAKFPCCQTSASPELIATANRTFPSPETFHLLSAALPKTRLPYTIPKPTTTPKILHPVSPNALMTAPSRTLSPQAQACEELDEGTQGSEAGAELPEEGPSGPHL